MNRIATSVEQPAANRQRQHAPKLIEESVFPFIRRTFIFFSEDGIMTHGGGVMSGVLKVRLRKGFGNMTHVAVCYEGHRKFIAVEGSPLEGDVSSREVFARLKETGMVGTPENS